MSEDTAKAVSDEELLDKIATLQKADYLGSWGQRELSIAEAEATRRKLKRRDSAR